MKKRYYDAGSIARALLEFERRYGVSTTEFYESYCNGVVFEDIPRFVQHVWGSFHRDYERLREEFPEPALAGFALSR